MPTAEPIMLKKGFGELPLLHELLPKAILQLASPLSNDDKEVLTYLIEYGRRAVLAEAASPSTCKSPWKPWKLASTASKRGQVYSSCSFSDSCTESSVLGEEVSSKRSLWMLANHKGSSTCDCFYCYSRFWSRWNGSPHRDLINEILDIVEEGPRSDKVKKKKRADKKRGVHGAETFARNPVGRDGNLLRATVQTMSKEDVTDMQTYNPVDMVMTSAMDGTSHAGIMTDEAPKIATQTPCTGRKKSMFRVVKQKEEASVANLKAGDGRVNKASGVTGLDEEALAALGLVGDWAIGAEAAVPVEVSGNFTTEAPEVIPVGLSPALLSARSTPRLHRIAKRRNSQVIPLDCEGFLDMEREQEAAITVESTQAPMSPRAADIGLGGRGFLARVFPDALGRVASRLWDLVSVRLRSRTVEYH